MSLAPTGNPAGYAGSAEAKVGQVFNLTYCFLSSEVPGGITLDLMGRIRRHTRGKLSERKIARRTGLSRNTVSKWPHAL